MVVVVDGFNGVRGSDLIIAVEDPSHTFPTYITFIVSTRAHNHPNYMSLIKSLESDPLSMAGRRVVSISSCWGRRPCPDKFPGYTLMPVAHTPVYVHYHIVATTHDTSVTTDTSGAGSVGSVVDSYPRGYRFRAPVPSPSSPRPRI